MASNIEIKAWPRDIESQERIAARLSDGPSVLIEQVDTFFHVQRGRLKLREFGDGTGELIAYDRPDASGPKQSTYSRSATDEPDSLKAALEAALGVRAVVKKKRRLFLVAQTRIHFDEVAGLGRFIELEVVLRPGQTEVEGRMIADRLMLELGIEPSDLIAGAYVDLLTNEEPNKASALGRLDVVEKHRKG
ncbi:class IV adenylate cyclase [Billgrantia gudaonensis]|uniref:Adenylate cyclase class IV, CYTH domain n=1 Tax=Billgrantia gudaonensis TaxID=376427 RepID=A0A1G8UVZ7_9GAMM|nr:class IV adenylate cyclase [Halomonas gudaonensis]SDJ58036.1 Adenylate cyclase class IV, CYTH domain [Halomonas gudaonensis]